MGDLLRSAAERAERYLQDLETRNVQPSADALAKLSEFSSPFPQESSDPEDILRQLDELGSPATIASAGGRYFGFVTGGALPGALAANWLAAAWDQNAFSTTSSPVAGALEEVALGWLLDALGLPARSAAFTTGATMANFSCLAAARDKLLAQTGWNIAEQGLFGAPPIQIVVGAEAHSTLFKALKLLGFGQAQVITVPVDDQGRMRADAFPELTGPAIVCLQAGNVNTGAFDPADALCPLAHRAGAWVHVDGAFGLWAAAAPERRHLTAGFEQADSWATDAHKWLNVPYDSGLAFVRDESALKEALSIDAPYLVQTKKREPFAYTPESSRRARGVDIWAALRCLGRSGLADLIERNCRCAMRFATGLAEAGYAILNEVALNQVLVSFGAAERTTAIIAAVQADGTCWCGGTIWRGQTAMRISVSSWATTEDDVEESLAAILRIAARRKPRD